MNWARHVLAIELKKAFSYRVDFWIQFIIGTAADLAVAYFLWRAIFAARGVDVMQGFTFSGIIYYYLFASFSMRISRGSEFGYLAQDIYDGGLTRYLLYPLPFLVFKFITHFSQQLLATLQLVVALIALAFFFGMPVGEHLSVWSIAAGIATCLLGGLLHFMITSCIEMAAFWQDVIWNLMVMLRFIVALLGGGMIPLAFFPAWGQTAIQWTPFPLLVSFPVKTFLGQSSVGEWFWNAAMMGAWALVFFVFVRIIWRRGTKQYTGVGI